LEKPSYFMKYLLPLFFVIANSVFAQNVSIIPQPVSIRTQAGTFTISTKTSVTATDPQDKKGVDFLNSYLEEFYGFKLDTNGQNKTNYIRLISRKTDTTGKDSYSLNVTANGVTIEGSTHPGIFYGVQSLIQLLPVKKSSSQQSISTLSIPAVTIQDSARFIYRGMHLDVGRHFFPVSFIKKYIDYIALHKMNYFHWHLTEDQGWRIEIKKYPRLTEVGAYRNGTIIGRYPGTGNDSTRYGGYYTQDEVREVVQYAADRYITVIPEIEMPGHSSAALTAYPWLGCPGTGPYKVEGTWGVFDDVYCAGKDSTFQFLQDVIDEVLTLFPSKYIHVGGDESPKANWKQCPLCQKRIKDQGLKDEHELQSYFIQRMEKYINSKGRTIIGWDEILEGGLAPNALVMSWRGEAGGIEAAKQKHKVVMTPGSHVYLDHSQSQNEDSVTIGGFTPVEKTYSYEPIPKELIAEEGTYVMGAQANVWTEYMRYPSKVEYQIFPRMSAVSEVLWSPKQARNWSRFEKKLLTQFKRYDLWGANYSKAYFDIAASIIPAPGNKGVAVKLLGRDKKDRLIYRTSRGTLKNYTSPVVIDRTTQLVALYYKDRQLMDSISFNINVNKATGKNITLKQQPSTYYPGNGAFTLVDGIINEKGGRTNESVGFQSDVEATINLGLPQQISSVTVHALKSGGSYVYPPQSIEVLGSTDGKTFETLGSAADVAETTGSKAIMKVAFNPAKVRYVRVVIKSLPAVPAGQRGAGEKPWLFVDEVQAD
jgi:hexosaminidase